MNSNKQLQLRCGCQVGVRCCACGGGGRDCYPLHYAGGLWRAYSKNDDLNWSPECKVKDHERFARAYGYGWVLFVKPSPSERKVMRKLFPDRPKLFRALQFGKTQPTLMSWARYGYALAVQQQAFNRAVHDRQGT